MIEAGGKLGKYELRGTLGKGAMGVVYEGWDPIIARRVAIKTVRLPDPSDAEAQEELARFRREAQAAGQLTHPNIVGVYDYGEDQGVAFIVMEYVDGPTLKSLLEKEERLPVAEIGRVMQDLLTGLAFSHARGVVHRDIKPANVMLSSDGRAKIADFGIARIESSSMTQAGTIMGTPAYMSPEQFMGQTVDARTDIYSSGVMLYQLLTGDRPFTGNQTAIMHKVLNTEPPKPSDLSVTAPPAFDAVVAKAMAKRPEQRFANAEAMAQAIRQALAPPAEDDPEATRIAAPPRAAPPPAEPVRPATAPEPKKGGAPIGLIAAGVAALAALGGGAYVMMGGGVAPPPPVVATPQPSVPPPVIATPQTPPAPVVPQTPSASDTAASEQAAREQTAREQAAREQAAREQTARDQTAREQAARDQAAREQAARDQAAREQAARDQTAREQAARDQAAREQAARDQTAREQAARDQAAREQAARDQAARDQAAREQAARDQAAREQAARDQAAREQAARDQAAREQAAREQAARDQAAREQAARQPTAASLRQALATALPQAFCSLVSGTAAADRVTLRGVVGQGTAERALRDAVGTAIGTTPRDWRVHSFDGPFCAALDAIRASAQPFGTAGALQVSLANNATRLRDGELITVALTGPDFPAFLQVSFLVHDGTVAHLHPTPTDPARAIPAGGTLRLGDPATGGPAWAVGPPFGTDMIIAIASSVPLFDRARPEAEDTDAYLRDLRAALDGARRRGARLAVDAWALETVAR